MTIILRDYQGECVDISLRTLSTPRPDGLQPHPAVVLPTGAGKTIIFSALGDKWHANWPDHKVMILAHRDELINQAIEKYTDVVPDARIGVIKSKRHEVAGRKTIVASVQSLDEDRLRRLGSWRPNLLIIDECHMAVAPTFRRIIEWAGCPVLGVTATLGRADGVALGRAEGGVFDETIYKKSILWMIRHGYLVDVKGQRIVVDDLDLKGLRKSRGDYREKELGERILGSSAPEAAAKAIREYAGGQPGVIFAPTVESAHAFTEAMRAEGFSCETVWGAMPLEHDQRDAFGRIVQKSRRRVLREFNLGKIDWLSNCMVLTHGFDAPRATVAVIARATQSEELYVQMVGRVLRLFPGKDLALVLDLVGATTQHELATIDCLAGSTPKDQTNKTLLELYGAPCEACMVPDDECEWRSDSPCCEDCSHQPAASEGGEDRQPEGPTRAIEADLFAGSRQQWLQTYAGYWFLPAGERIIAIAPRPDGSHDVVWCYTDKRGGETLARHITDLGIAMAQGEGDITSAEEVLARKAGRWRKHIASSKQIAWCKSQGLYTENMEAERRGAVGDKISIHKASARLDGIITARLEQAS